MLDSGFDGETSDDEDSENGEFNGELFDDEETDNAESDEETFDDEAFDGEETFGVETDNTESTEEMLDVEATESDGLDAEQNEVKNELMKEFVDFMQNNENATLKDFYAYVANKLNEEESNA